MWIKILNSYMGINLCPTKPKRTVLSLDMAVSRLMHDMQKYSLTFLQRQMNLMTCEVRAAYPLSLSLPSKTFKTFFEVYKILSSKNNILKFYLYILYI